MKNVLKVIGALVLAAAIAAGGYVAGQRAQISSISSALPKNILDKPEESAPVTENNISTESAAPQENIPPKDVVQIERNIIEKNSQTAAAEAKTVVSNVNINIAGESADVKLYTSADKDADGSFVWNDGNQWVLEVEKDGAYYTLLNKYVQLGKVSLMVADDENGEGVITAVVSTSSGLSVEKYTYNGTAFEGQTVYNSGILNVRTSTF
ncbi:MAG: hypothetical protein J1F01_02145 [Oscillospiraceae bacterium]|nr:hypothetical protein [Oscillospiraceae bacterium]